ncbi:MAG: hypothetical protein DSY42_09540 [Aquifex sp.]|nr:MAG: hypothetical protein DSY42_09540 [Aquifex sp.]
MSLNERILIPIIAVAGILLLAKKGNANVPQSNIKEIIRKEAKREGVPECILLGIAKTESGLDPRWFYRYHPDGVSYGAFGLTRGAVKTTGMNWNAVKSSVILQARASAKYLKWLKSKLGSWDLAIQAYNIGIGNVLRGRRNYAYLRKVKEACK